MPDTTQQINNPMHVEDEEARNTISDMMDYYSEESERTAELKKQEIIIKKLDENAKKPKVATEGSVGADLYSIEDIVLRPNKPELVGTGIAVKLPKGLEAQIRPRSSFGSEGIIVPNSPGTIDWDYRGEVKVCLMNLNDGTKRIREGDRIAQMVVNTIVPVNGFDIVDDLDDTDRGSGGFGSTGKS